MVKDKVRVVATAGHVDHGKSSLIMRLTGTDPDRWAEEKRRGMTIDLGFAWTALPSGTEVGFVDVPGHERFIKNMLAGVGPLRLVLFVVAADEGWKPQSEEHLQILDILGTSGAVVALTKTDLVAGEELLARTEEVKQRLRGTAFVDATIVACSSQTGHGIEDLRAALDAMVASAPESEAKGRPRQFIDRVFSIRGAGTVVTGTLTGGRLSVGQEAEILPSGDRARIRGLQTHKHRLESAVPVSRVAVNLAGVDRADLERGDVLGLPGQWRAYSVFEGWLRTVRTLEHPVTTRGAYKVYAGSAERDARLRVYSRDALRPGEDAFVRVTLRRPMVLDVMDAFVVRDAGRRETVAGGKVLDLDPPAAVTELTDRLTDRLGADRRAIAQQIITAKGAIKASDLVVLTGLTVDELVRLGARRLAHWVVDTDWLDTVAVRFQGALRSFHGDHPLREGITLTDARSVLAEAAGSVLSDPALADLLLEDLDERGAVVKSGMFVRLAEHSVSTSGSKDADRLVAAVEGAEPTPPSVRELTDAGFGPELIDAVCREGRLIRVSRDLVMSPRFVSRAESVLRGSVDPPGITVSSFREAIGTSRKYAVPLLEYFDARGVTRRKGDVRIVRA